MNTKKTTKKIVKPVYTVDMTDCETIEDLYLAFIDAKLEANLPINKIEFEVAIQDAIDDAVNAAVEELGDSIRESIIAELFGDYNALVLEDGDVIAVHAEPMDEKPNPLKRFWNWMTK